MPFALRVRPIFAILVLGLVVGVPAFAQMETATLTGVITDPKGGVVPDVEVTATRIETSTVVTGRTNGAGIYSFIGLMPGHYHVIVRKQGFKEIAIKEFQLYVQDKVEQNFSLEIGSVSETVTVTGGAPLVNTSDATVSTVITREQVENMPLNGRSFQSLLELTPGVVLVNANTGGSQGGGEFSINGQRSNSNYFTVDGVSANAGISITSGGFVGQSGSGSLPALTTLGTTSSLVSVDALQEFRIQTSSYAPEFGRTAGGQIALLTRSGTNQFHGTLFDYFRNDVLDANDWFANSRGLKKPPLRQNDFGGVLGGPVLLPGYNGRNRTFFFFSDENLQLRQPQVTLVSVPTVAARAQLAPAIKTLFDAFPQPTGRDLGNGLAEFSASYSDPSSSSATSIRVDQTLPHNLTIFGRYQHAPSSISARTGSLSSITSSDAHDDTVTVAANWIPSPSVAIDLRANWTKITGTQTAALDSFGGAIPPPDSALFESPLNHTNAIFNVSLVGTNGFAFGTGSDNIQRQFNLAQSLSWVRGTHRLKFGFDFRAISPISR